MTALTDGLHASLFSLAWLAGALLPYLALAGAVISALPIARRVRRRATSRQLHQAAQRSGRAPTPARVLNGTEHTRTGTP